MRALALLERPRGRRAAGAAAAARAVRVLDVAAFDASAGSALARATAAQPEGAVALDAAVGARWRVAWAAFYRSPPRRPPPGRSM